MELLRVEASARGLTIGEVLELSLVKRHEMLAERQAVEGHSLL